MPTQYDGSAEERRALDTYIKLSRAADAVTTRINAHLLQHKLTISQFGVLEAVYHLGPMQTSELGHKILKSSGNMTMVVDNLEKRGLVRRQRRPDDRRCILIHLTKHGESLVADLLPTHVAGVVDAFAVLTPEEQHQLADLCRKLGRSQTG